MSPEPKEVITSKVLQRTSLYDTKSPECRDKHMTANALEGIGKELKFKCKFYVLSCNDIIILAFI